MDVVGPGMLGPANASCCKPSTSWAQCYRTGLSMVCSEMRVDIRFRFRFIASDNQEL